MRPNRNKNEGCFLRGLQWLTMKLKLVDEDATPPDWGYLTLVFASFFTVQFSLLIVLPFMPAMILHLGIPENDKGTYVGLLTSCLYIGTVIGSMFWGWVADTKGRKIVLVLCSILGGLSIVGFGFSANIPMALAMKFCLGASNGVSTTCRAVLYDVSDTSNQAIGMVLLTLGWGLASFVASFIAGYLTEPCSRWPDFCDEESFLGQFPFLLPCIVPGVVAILLAVFLFFKFEETLVKSTSSGDEISVGETAVDECESNSVHERKNSQSSNRFHNTLAVMQSTLSRSTYSLNPGADMNFCLGKDVLEKTISDNGDDRVELYLSKSVEGTELPSYLNQDLPLYRGRAHSEGEKKLNGISDNPPDVAICSQPKDSTLSNIDIDSTRDNIEPLLEETPTHWEEDHICHICDRFFKLGCASCTNSSLHNLLRLSDVWASISVFFMLCLATVGTEDIIPVFVSTPSDAGGLGFSTSEIGTALGLISVPLLILQIKIYTFLVSKLRIRKTYLLGSFICLLGAQTLPMLTSLNNSPTWLWVTLIINQTVFRLSANCCFSSISLLINNSVPQDLAGQVNGLSMAVSCVGRALAPVAVGSVFSWSVAKGQFIGAPFDTGFSFFLMGIVYGISLLQCLVINPNLEKQKKAS